MESLLKASLSGLITRGALEVCTASGARFTVGDGSAPDVALRFRDRRAQWAFLIDPELRLGELYMDGRVHVERGSLHELLALLVDNASHAQTPRWLARLDDIRFARRRRQQRNDRGRSQRNVAHHYDLGDTLYELFLDDDRQYSCAYFEQPQQSLEAAQLAKKRHVAAKLDIKPGQTVLDIGCGWGGLALYLAEIADAGRVHGITLSREQLRTATARAQQRDIAGRVQFELADYRDVSGSFDRIVSVGMFEHVGRPFYETYFRHCRRLLKDDGILLLHTIGCTGVPAHPDPWLDKYIFPGGYVPSLSQMMPVIEASGLVVSDIEVLRLHYASTLKAWRDRFAKNRERACALGDERFCRMWEYYLAFCETVFRHDDIVVFQLLLAARNDAVPLTRDYIAAREAEYRRREHAWVDAHG